MIAVAANSVANSDYLVRTNSDYAAVAVAVVAPVLFVPAVERLVVLPHLHCPVRNRLATGLLRRVSTSKPCSVHSVL